MVYTIIRNHIDKCPRYMVHLKYVVNEAINLEKSSEFKTVPTLLKIHAVN